MPAGKGHTFILIAIFALTSISLIGHYLNRQPRVDGGLRLESALLDRIGQQYGAAARQRLVDWQALMDNGKALPELEKLQRVNDFFNRNIAFVDDQLQWQKRDYWATPVEFLYTGAGDCEDFAIAKYFTLLEMGVDESKLRITYVKALQLNQAHMVLTYFTDTHAEPLVLDNLMSAISPATVRHDLQPVYSFNGSGLWRAKVKGSGRLIGDAEQLNPWADLKRRMIKETL